jgi:hypothetical protein
MKDRTIDKPTETTYKREALALRRERLDKNESARSVCEYAATQARRELIEHLMRNETGE